MCDHIEAIMRMIALLCGSGKPLEGEEVVAVLLMSLPESYSGLVTALEERDEKDLTIEYVTGKILVEHQRRSESQGPDDSNSDVALKLMCSSKGDHSKKIQCNKNSIFNKTGKETRSCYYCHKLEHLK